MCNPCTGSPCSYTNKFTGYFNTNVSPVFVQSSTGSPQFANETTLIYNQTDYTKGIISIIFNTNQLFEYDNQHNHDTTEHLLIETPTQEIPVRVVDETGVAIPNARVTLRKASAHSTGVTSAVTYATHTDPFGETLLFGVGSTLYTINTTASGYNNRQDSYTMSDDATPDELRIVLTKSQTPYYHSDFTIGCGATVTNNSNCNTTTTQQNTYSSKHQHKKYQYE